MVPNPIKMDDLGGPPLFLETPICIHLLIVMEKKLNEIIQEIGPTGPTFHGPRKNLSIQ